MKHLNFPERLRFKAVIFDLDGVVTDTAIIHKESWKFLFNEFLKSKFIKGFQREFEDRDYYEFVDGRPRLEGIRSFFDVSFY